MLPPRLKVVLGLHVCKSEAAMEEHIKHCIQYNNTHDESGKLLITVLVVRNARPVNNDQNERHCWCYASIQDHVACWGKWCKVALHIITRVRRNLLFTNALAMLVSQRNCKRLGNNYYTVSSCVYPKFPFERLLLVLVDVCKSVSGESIDNYKCSRLCPRETQPLYSQKWNDNCNHYTMK